MNKTNHSERTYINHRLRRFRFRLLVPVSLVFAILMTIGAILAMVDGSMAVFRYIPFLCVAGSWASVYFTVVKHRIREGFILLAVSVLAVTVIFPFFAPNPLEGYQMFGAFIYSIFIILLVLSGLFGQLAMANITASLYFVQFIFIYFVFAETPTWQIFLSSNIVVPFISVGVLHIVTLRHHSLVEGMISDLLKTHNEKRELAEISTTDALTGLYNRRFIETVMTEHKDRANRYGSKFSCLIIDADKFKDINDTYGHNVGDEVLKGVASIVREGSRQSDICSRWGGEEFLIVTPTAASSGLVLGERIRMQVENTDFAVDEVTIAVTVSIGIAEFQGGNDSEADLVRRSDMALYQAKQNGRNQVRLDESLIKAD